MAQAAKLQAEFCSLGCASFFGLNPLDAGDSPILIEELDFALFDKPNSHVVIDIKATTAVNPIANQDRLLGRSVLSTQANQGVLNLISNGIEQLVMMHSVSENSTRGQRIWANVEQKRESVLADLCFHRLNRHNKSNRAGCLVEFSPFFQDHLNDQVSRDTLSLERNRSDSLREYHELPLAEPFDVPISPSTPRNS